MVQPIPDDYPRVSPTLSVDGAAEAIDFYVNVLGMTERMRIDMGGKIGHSELALGDSLIMVADEFPEMGFVGPKSLGGTPVHMTVYVEDVDAIFAAALEAGASELRSVEDQFYGDRSGQFEDPWGHAWNVMTHVEDVDPEELARRSEAAMAEMGEGS
ncbi:VOC family protein [Candidatus Poriferisodalis sp.]|uniref:VOC family protein n=1 Tax=Candidatus Poriferisodalis sp. TaxID=3101277 RepID=UPI003B5A6553